MWPRRTGAAVALALGLAGCGSTTIASGRTPSRTGSHGDQSCLRAAGLAVRAQGDRNLLIGSSVRVHFTRSATAAQDEQLKDHEQGAEVIGSALLYPDSASDAELRIVERCLDAGAAG